MNDGTARLFVLSRHLGHSPESPCDNMNIFKQFLASEGFTGKPTDWMYNYSLGIQRDPKSPGFKHFVLNPRVDPTGKIKFLGFEGQ